MPSLHQILKDGVLLLTAGTLAALIWEGWMFAAGFAAAGALCLVNIRLIGLIVERMLADAAAEGTEHLGRSAPAGLRLGVGFVLKVLVLGLAFTGLALTFPLFAVLSGFNAVLLGIAIRSALLPWARRAQET